MSNKKKVLITQNSLRNLSGTEIVTLELATYLVENDYEVSIYTLYFDDPIKEYFVDKKLTVITNEDDLEPLDSYNIIWVHHQIIPDSFIDKIGNTQKDPLFVFSHMSPILGLEFPYIHHLEDKIASLVLHNSEGTYSAQKEIFDKDTLKRTAILPNFITDSFIKDNPAYSSLEKILIVSNHPPEEVKEAAHLLTEAGLTVDFLGDVIKKQTLVTSEILSDYQAVITIGKTVQYCIGLNIPVYVYDHFGGPGYISDSNIDKLRNTTFSGRVWFSKKTAQEIKDDLINDYTEAYHHQVKIKSDLLDQYHISNVSKLLDSAKKITLKPFDINYANYVRSVRLLINNIIIENNIISKQNNTNYLKVSELETTVEKIESKLSIEVKNFTEYKSQRLIRYAEKATKIIRNLRS